MKHDINLLQKKKATQYSSKKLGTLLLIVVLFAALIYGGIALPTSSLSNAQIRLVDLNKQVSDQSEVNQELAQKTQHNAELQEALKQLETLSATRQDVAKYMEAVESSLPTSAAITSIQMSENTMSVTGTAPRDEVLATFALRLRETKVFSSVFVTSSTNPDGDNLIVFLVRAVLPTPLSNAAAVTDGSDGEDKSGNDSGNGSDSNDEENKPDSGDAIIADGGANTVASTDAAENGGVNQ
jgi:Tfp pilus assembly protein PilN